MHKTVIFKGTIISCPYREWGATENRYKPYLPRKNLPRLDIERSQLKLKDAIEMRSLEFLHSTYWQANPPGKGLKVVPAGQSAWV
jgi:hypothetical protein